MTHKQYERATELRLKLHKRAHAIDMISSSSMPIIRNAATTVQYSDLITKTTLTKVKAMIQKDLQQQIDKLTKEFAKL